MKSTILDTIIRAFVKDLTNANIKLKITRTIIAIDRSLKVTYNLIEKIQRTKIKINKFQEKKFKNKKLDFYRILVQKTISKTQLNLFITIYQSQLSKTWNFESLFSFLFYQKILLSFLDCQKNYQKDFKFVESTKKLIYRSKSSRLSILFRYQDFY